MDLKAIWEMSGNYNKMRRYYVSLSVIFLNTILIFVGINLILYAAILARDEFSSLSIGANSNQILKSYGPAIYTLYPDLSDDEVDQLRAETRSRPFVFEPFTQFKERPYRGKYVNVDANGFRVGKD